MRLVPIYTPDNPSFISADYVKPVIVALDNHGAYAVSTMPLKFEHEHNLLDLSYDRRLVDQAGLIGEKGQDIVAPYLGITKIIMDILGRAVVINVARLAPFTFRDTDSPGLQKISAAVVEYDIALSSLFSFVADNESGAVKVKITCDGWLDMNEGHLKVMATWTLQNIDSLRETMKEALWSSFKPVGFDIFANRMPAKNGRV